MIWKTPTSTAEVAPAEELELEVEGQSDSIVRAGASIHGWIYRSLEHPRCYRLVPLDEMPMQRKHDLQKWVGHEYAGTIITKAWQPTADLPFYVVEYEVDGLQGTLAEALADPVPRNRLNSAISFLDALEDWWELLGSPLLPMPTDVALTRGGRACPLPLPPWTLPDVEGFLAVPERLQHLAPEVVRSQTLPGEGNSREGQALDRFSAAVGLLGCFHSWPAPESVEVAFQRAANGTLVRGAIGGNRLPAWANQVASTQEVRAALECWVSRVPVEREGVTPEVLVDLFSRCRDQLEPAVAVCEVRDTGSPSEAFDLAEKILFEDEDTELLTLAGDLAVKVGRPLEALDYYERAIGRASDPGTAAEAQLRVVVSARKEPGPIQNLFMLEGPVGTQLDEKLWRDFRLLTEDQKKVLEIDMARHLLWRGERLATSYVSAARFIAERLGVSNGEFQWWNLDMNVAYAEALLGQGALPQVRSQLATIKGALNKLRGSITEGEFRHWAERLGEVGGTLVRLEQERTSGGPR